MAGETERVDFGFPNGTISQHDAGIPKSRYTLTAWAVQCMQLYCSSLPWRGCSHSSIVQLVVSGRGWLRFPPNVPMDYIKVTRACMAANVASRPAVTDVVAVLSTFARHVQQAADFMSLMA